MNILIVESHNDQYFIQALVNRISTENKIYRIDEYRHSSLDEEKLSTQIESVLNPNRDIQKIGIIIDMDNATKHERITLVNRCISKALIKRAQPIPQTLLTDVSQFVIIPIDDLSVQIACFFTNVDGQGELETVLKVIKTKDSVFADCLYDGWKKCFEAKKKIFCQKGEQGDISDKELLKLWVDFYKRFDTLKKKDRDEKATKWETIMLGEKGGVARGEDIFDLKHPKLNDLREFLSLFD